LPPFAIIYPRLIALSQWDPLHGHLESVDELAATTEIIAKSTPPGGKAFAAFTFPAISIVVGAA
jgi:hypothetical protein